MKPRPVLTQEPPPIPEPPAPTRRRAVWIVCVALLMLAGLGSWGLMERQRLKVAANMWLAGAPPVAHVLDPAHPPAETLVPIHAGDDLLPDGSRQLSFSPWNWAFGGGQAVSNTPGAYFKIRFTGRRLSARFDLAWLRASGYPASSYPTVTTRVDGGPPRRVALTPDQAELDLLGDLPLSPDPAHAHTATVWFSATHFDKGDRWQTPVAALRLSGLTLAPGATLHPAPVRPRRLLVFGDSHAEGVELTGAVSWTVHQDARLAFPQQLADAWDAEVGVVAFGGSGYVEPVSGADLPPAIETWDHCWNGVSRLNAEGRLVPAPDLILSALGDNDPDREDVSHAVTDLARAWRSAAPDAELLFALPPNDGADGFRARLQAGLARVTDHHLRVLDPGENFLAQPALSFGNHLNADGQRAYARALLAAYDQNDDATGRSQP